MTRKPSDTAIFITEMMKYAEVQAQFMVLKAPQK